MPKKIIFPALCIASFCGQAAQSQPASCPQELKWSDSTYQRRITRAEGKVIEASVELFSNGSALRRDVDGDKAGVIVITDKNGSGRIYFTYGRGQPRPFDFIDIALAVTPPLFDLSDPPFVRPCGVKEHGALPFSETDIPPDIRKSTAQKFRGTLKRAGLRIDYSVDVQQGPEASPGPQTWTGTWRHERVRKSFPLTTDVQGWHVHRGDTLLMTLPVGKPVSMASALKQVSKLPD